MQREAEYDELVMTLVESALRKAPPERETYLRSACGNNTALFEDVMSRVSSEERMAGFLAEPVLRPRQYTSDEAPFEVGELVGGRFRILRRVGQGGMGVVYEALDEKLDRRIAIKGARVGFRNRLPPEARAASEVSHYNICKVHELHTAGDIEFLTMEFVDGETLAERLRSLDPLTEDEARSIIRQIAAGLAQAHRQGVVHGDLKPGNVLLARQPDGSTRAVITDFGLAKLMSGTGGLAMSDRGGTLDYMAPELLHGGRATVASDVYAFGVMIREMIGPALTKPKKTSEPTPSESTLTLARAEAALRDRAKQVDLPAPWSTVVNRCTAVEASQRYTSADDIAANLQRRRPWIVWAIAATMAIVLAAGFGLWRWTQTPLAAVRLAVLPMAVDGASQSPALAGLGYDISTQLARSKGIVVMPPGDAAQYGVKSAEQAAKTLGATHALSTTVTQRGPDLIAYASLVEASTGRVVRELRGVYAPGDSAGLAKAILGTITSGLRLPALSVESVSPAAYSDYIQGVALLNRDNNSASLAIPYLDRAALTDPKSPLPVAALAEANYRLYRNSKDRKFLQAAEQFASKANALNPDVAEVALIGGMLQMESGKYALAAEAFQRATQLAPGNPVGWSRLAVAYGNLQRPEDALATFRKSAEVQPNYFRHYLDWFAFHWSRSEYPEAEAVIRRLIAIAPDFYSGHTNLAAVLMDEGRFAEAEAEARESLLLRESSSATYLAASILYYQRRFVEAIPMFERTLKLGVALPAHYFALGDALQFAGREADARKAWQTGLDMAEQLVLARPQDGAPRSILALFAVKLGDSKRAVYEIAQAVQMAPDDGKVRRRAAETYQLLGDLDSAIRVLQEGRPALLAELSRSPNFEKLQSDPRFQQLLQQKGR